MGEFSLPPPFFLSSLLSFFYLSLKYRKSADKSEITDFFLFGQKNPFGELFSEMTSKGSISFFFLRNLQNLKNRPAGPSVAAMRLEIWNMLNMLVWAYQTLFNNHSPKAK